MLGFAQRPERGRTPLHDATAAGRRDMMELLLSRGASTDAAAADGERALHLAAAAGSVDNAWVLCRYGADTAATDARGHTARDAGRDDRLRGAPVDEDEARVVFGEYLCARGVKAACGPVQ